MTAKDIARLMAQKGVRPKRRLRRDLVPSEKKRRQRRQEEAERKEAPAPRLIDAFQEVPPSAQKNPQSVYRVPDSWEAPKKVLKKPLPAEPEPDNRRGPKRKPQHKRRGTSLTFSVSPEEEFYLRKFAADKGMSFSEWARATLFKAMGQDIPSRE